MARAGRLLGCEIARMRAICPRAGSLVRIRTVRIGLIERERASSPAADSPPSMFQWRHLYAGYPPPQLPASTRGRLPALNIRQVRDVLAH